MPAAPRTTASLSAGTRPVAAIRSATSSASALIGGAGPRRPAPPGGVALPGSVPGVRRFGGRSMSIYPSFEVSAVTARGLIPAASTTPLQRPISPWMRDVLRSPPVRVWVPVLSAAAVAAYLDRRSDPGDLVYFVHRGGHLLSAGWASTFADPMLQSGPLQLVVFGAVRNLTALAFLVELGVAGLLLFVAGRVGAADRVRLVVGLLAVLAGLTHLAFVDGHPADAIVPLLWVLAGVWAREDRALQAGALIGVSAGLELWGVLGLPLLLLVPRRRRALAGAVATGAVVVGMLAPFALAGSFPMLAFDWRVPRGT